MEKIKLPSDGSVEEALKHIKNRDLAGAHHFLVL
jgi:hypothetical protein